MCLRTIVFASLLAFTHVMSLQASVRLELGVDAQRTLPGIPVSFLITIQNTGPDPVRIVPHAVLVARNQAGERFTVACGPTSDMMRIGESEITLASNASTKVNIAADGTLFKPAWFLDNRLLMPGVLELQLFLPGKTDGAIIAPEAIPSDAPSSNVIMLAIEEPHGKDAEVWALMRKFGAGRWNPMLLLNKTGEALARRIVDEYPDSSYAGWFATYGPGSNIEGTAERFRRWLEQYGRSDRLTQRRRLLLATWDAMIMRQFSILEPEKSRLHGELARSALSSLANSASDEELRMQARQKLEEISD